MHHELENLLGTQENKSDITTVPQEEKHRLRLSLDENSEDYDALGIGNVSLAAGVGVGEHLAARNGQTWYYPPDVSLSVLSVQFSAALQSRRQL